MPKFQVDNNRQVQFRKVECLRPGTLLVTVLILRHLTEMEHS